MRYADRVVPPDLTGLLAVHRILLALSDPDHRALLGPAAPTEAAFPWRDDVGGDRAAERAGALRRDTVWEHTLGGLAALLSGLVGEFTAAEPARRYAAASLVAEVAEPVEIPSPLERVRLLGEESWSHVADPESVPVDLPSPSSDDDVQFTVHRPRQIRPARWHPLLVFAHRAAPFTDEDGVVVDPQEEVRRQAQLLLGARASLYGAVVTDSAAALPRGNEIVFEPWLDGGEVNPARYTVRWEKPVHRAEFDIRAPAGADGLRLNGGVRVRLGILLIAELRFAVVVGASVAAGPRQLAVECVDPYRHIFASYSHLDTEIVQRVRAAVATLGDRYTIDVQDLRAGERWQPRLAEMIVQADVFQLFWSRNSMSSAFVRQEWEHALALGKPNFVRPVYWEHPRPEDPGSGLPPAALDVLHFHRLEAERFPAPPSRTGYGSYQYPAYTSSAPPPPPPPAAPRRNAVIAALVAAVVVVLVVLFVFFAR